MPDSPPSKKPWAVLAYTIAEDPGTSSQLDTTAKRELKAICDAADWRKISVAAQVDFKNRRGVYRGALTQLAPKGRGFEDIDPENHELWAQVKESVRAGEAAVRLQRDATDLNATRPDVLEDFLRFGREHCPADRYLVSFFGHAAGPLGLFDDKTSGATSTDIMRLPTLVNGFQGAGSRADVVLFRDCFMNCLETAYQLRRSTEFIVASQALAPAVGTWPWRDFMRTLANDAAPYDVALALVKALAAYLDADAAHREHMEAIPYSLLDLSAADEVATRLSALADALEAARQDPARRRACAKALEAARVGTVKGAVPGDPALLDVPTLCGRLAGLSGDPVAKAAAALGRAVSSKLVRWHHSQTKHHLGTSLFYAPVRKEDRETTILFKGIEPVATEDAAAYRALALSKATGWHRVALDPLPID